MLPSGVQFGWLPTCTRSTGSCCQAFACWPLLLLSCLQSHSCSWPCCRVAASRATPSSWTITCCHVLPASSPPAGQPHSTLLCTKVWLSSEAGVGWTAAQWKDFIIARTGIISRAAPLLPLLMNVCNTAGVSPAAAMCPHPGSPGPASSCCAPLLVSVKTRLQPSAAAADQVPVGEHHVEPQPAWNNTLLSKDRCVYSVNWEYSALPSAVMLLLVLQLLQQIQCAELHDLPQCYKPGATIHLLTPCTCSPLLLLAGCHAVLIGPGSACCCLM